MAKIAPDAMIDSALNYVAGSNYMSVCSGCPLTFANAYTGSMLALVSMASGSFVVADDASGRKVTVGAKSAVSITNSGFAQHVALVESGGSTLRYVTTCTGQALVAAGTVDIPTWTINIADPT